MCEVCNEMGNLLCCDSCKLAYHTHCLSPPITSVPEGDWACPECVAAGMSAQALAKVRIALKHWHEIGDPQHPT